MAEFNIALLVIAGAALVLGLVSKSLKRVGLPDSVTLLILGVALGPAGLAWLNPQSWGEPMILLEQVARLALAVGLMDVALRIPRSFVVKHWRGLALVIGLGMPFMWLSSSVLIAGAMGVSLGAALLIAAVVTPTDPVVASSMVTGPVAENALPANLRQIISAEAGANDGLAYLFVVGSSFIFTLPGGGPALPHVLDILLQEILGALLMGTLIGSVAGYGLRKAEAHDLIEPQSVLMFTTALAIATLAAVKLMGSDGILAVFVTGLAFDQQVGVQERREEERVVGGFDRFFTGPIFVLVGLTLPWEAWKALSWPALLLIIGILLLRRLPLFLLLAGRCRELPLRRDGAFAGWFGPIGVAAVYYAALAHHKTHLPEVWPLVSLLVVASVLVHGLSAVPFSRLYRRREQA